MMRRFAAIGLTSAVVSLAMAGQVAGQAERPRSHAPRTPWGTPDLNGTWTGSTLTPLERPKEFTGKAVLAPEEAAALEARARERNAREPQAGPGDPVPTIRSGSIPRRQLSRTVARRSSWIRLTADCR